MAESCEPELLDEDGLGERPESVLEDVLGERLELVVEDVLDGLPESVLEDGLDELPESLAGQTFGDRPEKCSVLLFRRLFLAILGSAQMFKSDVGMKTKSLKTRCRKEFKNFGKNCCFGQCKQRSKDHSISTVHTSTERVTPLCCCFFKVTFPSPSSWKIVLDFASNNSDLEFTWYSCMLMM